MLRSQRLVRRLFQLGSRPAALRFFSDGDAGSISSTDVGNSSNYAFDRDLKRQQRDNAARASRRWRDGSDRDGQVVSYDYFRQEISARIVDRLDDIRREEGFPLALEIGAGSGTLHRAICSDDAFEGSGGIGGIRKLVQLDSSHIMLHRDEDIPVEGQERCGTYRMTADEEAKMPFPDGTFDLVLSSVSMHWINELPALFKEVKVRIIRQGEKRRRERKLQCMCARSFDRSKWGAKG